MGFRLSGQLLETSTGLTPAQKLMLLGLAERADRLGRYAFPSVATLAQYAECSERTVELGLQALVAGGWISVQRKATNRMPTTYVVNLERLSGGEETSPQRVDTPPPARGEESSPLENARGELFSTAGANFSTARGEETSPDPVSTEPIQQEPIQRESVDGATLRSPAGLIAVWNALREPGPKVGSVPTANRSRHLGRALDEHPRRDDWSTAILWLNRQRFANAPGSGDHPTWRASLDWLAKPGKLADVLDSARTDAAHPPPRPTRVVDTPAAGLTDEMHAILERNAQRRREAKAALDKLVDEAAALVLDMSVAARGVLERAALLELEPYRERADSPAQFDEWVCKALPLQLIKRAKDRPLADVAAELEKAAAA